MNDELTAEQIAHIYAIFDAIPYVRFLGMRLGEVKRGLASVHLEVRDELRQNRGVVHGGVIASLLDTATAFAAVTILEIGEQVTTTDLTIHYLRPAIVGKMTGTARLIRAGKRIIVLSAEVTGDGQSLLATAVTSYIKLS